MKDFDVVVIGSGIGGLISAGILTAKGLKTLVVERHSTPGGYLASFKRNGFVFDAALDCISGVSPGGLIGNVLELLNVSKEVDFIKIDPIRVSIFPDIEIAVDADVNTYLDKLTTLFPAETAAISSFFKRSDKVYNELQSVINTIISGDFVLDKITPDIVNLMNISYKEFLSGYVADYRLKAVLADRCPFIGLPPSNVSALSMVSMIMSYFKLDACRPVGGFQKLADVLTGGIRKMGGEAVFGNGVKRILLDAHDSCKRITCDNGEEYTTRYVISNADFYHTFVDLIGGKYASFANEMMVNTGSSTSFFMVYAGIKGDAGKRSSIGYYPSYDMESFFLPDKILKEDSTLGMTIASIEDTSRVPKDCNTIVIHEMVDVSVGKHIDKSEQAMLTIKKAEKIIPAIKDRLVVLDAATPQTLQRYTGNYHGAAFGWRQTPGFRRVRKHGISNLYIAGHWGYLGGGVLAAAYSGAEVAGEILAKEGIKIDL